MHKTGSTAIQHALADYDDGHTFYPTLSPEPNHSFAIAAHFGDMVLQHVKGKPGYTSDELERAFKSLVERSLKRRRVIVYAEYVSAPMSVEGKQRLLEYLFCCFKNMHVHMYSREPLSWVGSAVSQRVREGHNISSSNLAVRYRDRLEFWEDQLGLENISVADYHKSSAEFGSVVRHFEDLLGIKLRPQLSDATPLQSLPWTVVRVLSNFNRIRTKRDAQTDAAIRWDVLVLLSKAYAGSPTLSREDLLGCVDCPLEEVDFLKRFDIHYDSSRIEPRSEAHLFSQLRDISDIKLDPLIAAMEQDGIRVPKSRHHESLLKHLEAHFSSKMTRSK